MYFLGVIKNPFESIGTGNSYGDLGASNGPVFFLSNIVKLVSIGAGIFAFINFIIAGYEYLTAAGNTDTTARAISRINMSAVGLALIVGSHAIAAVLGLVLFGRWDAILNPQIYGPN